MYWLACTGSPEGTQYSHFLVPEFPRTEQLFLSFCSPVEELASSLANSSQVIEEASSNQGHMLSCSHPASEKGDFLQLAPQYKESPFPGTPSRLIGYSKCLSRNYNILLTYYQNDTNELKTKMLALDIFCNYVVHFFSMACSFFPFSCSL